MKAFDKEPQRRHEQILNKFWITNLILRLFYYSVRTYRYQKVSVKGETFDWKEETSGITQGSV